jgi:nucleoside-diphosphate-sugar epimerase
MITLSPTEKIAITGAGGWLGTELLEKLVEQHGRKVVEESVVCFGSRKRIIALSDGTQLEIHPLSEPSPVSEFTGVVHLAFQTRDKVEILGHEEYCYENLKITSSAIKLIESCNPKWVATVSSGAVHSKPGGPLENDVVANPYGFTKRIEETMLESVAKSIGANLAVGRLWGAMGRFMPPNPAYAVSDFIQTGLGGNQIVVKAKNKVFRRYVDAGEFMDVLVTTAQNQSLTTFDSGGQLLEMSELAELIADEVGVSVAKRELDRSLADNVYYPKSMDYENLAASSLIDLTEIRELIVKTVRGHK